MNLAIGRVQVTDPPVPQFMSARRHRRNDDFRSGHQDAVLQPTELFAAVDHAESWLRGRSLQAAQAAELLDLFQIENLVVSWIVRPAPHADQDLWSHGTANT